MNCPQLEHLYIIKYLCDYKSFLLVFLFLHSYQSFVITLHAQLEFLHLAGKQTPRSHEHINSSQSVTGDMVHAHIALTEVD